MAVIDDIAYADLLVPALPRVIESDAENERMVAESERLDALTSKTPEQETLAELLTIFIRSIGMRTSSITPARFCKTVKE